MQRLGTRAKCAAPPGNDKAQQQCLFIVMRGTNAPLLLGREVADAVPHQTRAGLMGGQDTVGGDEACRDKAK